MKIVVGLGNPGPKYETTRHNVGFLAVDRLVEKWNATGPSNKNNAEIFQADVAGEKVYLVKPQTYMNRSGQSVAPLFQFYQCTPGDLIVIHDDLDLNSMALRLKTGGGAGGHNGLKSIDESLGKERNGYHRARIGIGHPTRTVPPLPISPADYVLMQFSDAELEKLNPVLDEVAGAVEEIVKGRMQAAMTLVNRSKE